MLKTLAVVPTGVVANTVGVLGFKQPVLIKLPNISKECTSVHVLLDIKDHVVHGSTSKTFMHKNDLYSLAICLPNSPIESPQLQDHKPFSILNRNARVNILKKCEGKRTKPFFGNPVCVILKARLKSPILANKPIVVPVDLIVTDKRKLPLRKTRIFRFDPNSLSKKFAKAKVMNHLFVPQNDSADTMHAQIVLCCTDSPPTVILNDDYIGLAVMFNSSNPDQVQQCVTASSLQAGYKPLLFLKFSCFLMISKDLFLTLVSVYKRETADSRIYANINYHIHLVF